MQEVKLKTHLIITDIHEEYHINWCGRLFDAQPAFNECGMPTFVIVGSQRRMEVNTTDMIYLEKCAKRLTHPKGRTAITKDTARIYIKEIDGNERLVGVLTHRRIKTFAPMYDSIGYK